MIDNSLRTFILSNPEVDAILDNRYYIDREADNPGNAFIKARLITAAPMKRTHTSRLDVALWQLDINNADIGDCEALTTIVRDMCDGYSGDIGGYNVFMTYTAIRSDFDEKARLFIRQLDIEVKYGKP